VCLSVNIPENSRLNHHSSCDSFCSAAHEKLAPRLAQGPHDGHRKFAEARSTRKSRDAPSRHCSRRARSISCKSPSLLPSTNQSSTVLRPCFAHARNTKSPRYACILFLHRQPQKTHNVTTKLLSVSDGLYNARQPVSPCSSALSTLTSCPTHLTRLSSRKSIHTLPTLIPLLMDSSAASIYAPEAEQPVDQENGGTPDPNAHCIIA
jgi:hypothetical protein